MTLTLTVTMKVIKILVFKTASFNLVNDACFNLFIKIAYYFLNNKLMCNNYYYQQQA